MQRGFFVVEVYTMGKFIDLTGKRFGRLTVVERAENKNGYTMWKCKCDCGNETVVYGAHLSGGKTKSCGCLCLEKISKHSLCDTHLYRIWASMKDRCYNAKAQPYERYGGRGITVCDEWKNDFTTFYNWAMSNGYSDDLTIDRIDVNGNYEPSNCRWVDVITQANNKRNNIKVNLNGEIVSLRRACILLGLRYKTEHQYLMRHGYDSEMQRLNKYVELSQNIDENV